MSTDSIKNISDITLPEMVNDVLSRGPKYAILTPFDKMGFYKDVDKIIQSKSSDICTKVTAAALSYTDNPCNKKFDQRIKPVRKFLRENDLIATPFDKGRGYCICTQQQYNDKMFDIINGRQFEVFNQRANVTRPMEVNMEDRFNTNLNKLIKSVPDKFMGPLPKNTMRWSCFQKLAATGSRIPHMYGVAKVHKTNIPMRPIISAPGGYYFELASCMAEILKKMPGAQIECKASEVKRQVEALDGKRYIVSYDAESLFTNVPVKDAIAIARDLLPQSCFLDKDAFEKLLTLCSVDTVFQFNQKYFVQKDGVAMGSPVGPLLANIYLSHLEKSLPDIGVNIKLWKRYVDYVIAIVDSKYEAEKLLTAINKWSSTVHFTMETEDNYGTIEFSGFEITIQLYGKML